MKKIVLLLFIPFILTSKSIQLETIKINATGEDKEELFIQSEGYMKSAPMQKRITGKQALSLEAVITRDRMKLNDTMQKDKDPIAVGKINTDISSNFRKNVAGIDYDDNYQEDGKYYQMGFLPSIHINYRF